METNGSCDAPNGLTASGKAPWPLISGTSRSSRLQARLTMITWRGQSCSLRHKPESNTSICAHCTSDVFNHRLYHDLRSAATKSSVELVYSRPSSDLYASTRAGCPWCSSISHTIRVVAEDINFRNSEDDDADQEFDQFPITSLCCEAVAKITVWFQKRQCRTAFDSVDIQIEVTETRGEACTLPEIAGDDSILLKFALSSNGREPVFIQGLISNSI